MAEWNCVTAAAAIRAGQVTPADLVEHCLSRIERFEPRVRAWVMVDADGARKEAQRLGDELQRGFDRGPLHGLPIGIKDIFDMEGWPTKAGSPLREGHRAERDSTVVARLRQAGAIFLGKTVTTEWASFDPPPTRNPWNLERTPGGSSSGSAAAVAMGMCLAAMGSQTGGSITRPASYCGVAGCKPAYGTVPLDGIVALAPSMDHPGPMARTAWDLALILKVIADHRESSSSNSMPSPTSFEPNASPGLMRFCYAESFFDAVPDNAVQAATRAAIHQLRLAGAEIVEEPLPAFFKDAFRMHRRIMAVECARLHEEDFAKHRDQIGPWVASLIEEGLKTPEGDYREALQIQALAKSHADWPTNSGTMLLMPATVTAAPARDSTGDPKFNSIWSYTGFPTVSVPCGLTPDGLPVSLQLIGSPLAEEWLLLAADWCQNRLNFDATPPLIGEVA